MKRYVKASEAYRSYSEVSKALNVLFGFAFDKYKKKSDWFDSE